MAANQDSSSFKASRLKRSFIIEFYDSPSGTRDSKGRTLHDILEYDDDQLEYYHDYIQVVFPLPEPSMVNGSASLIDRQTFEAFRSEPQLRVNLRLIFDRMLTFYGLEWSRNSKIEPSPTFWANRKDNWLQQSSHNHLRITRIIRSIRILGLEEEAEAFFVALELIFKTTGRISSRSLEYWRRAAQRPLNVPPHSQTSSASQGKGFLRDFEALKSQPAKNSTGDVSSRD